MEKVKNIIIMEAYYLKDYLQTERESKEKNMILKVM